MSKGKQTKSARCRSSSLTECDQFIHNGYLLRISRFFVVPLFSILQELQLTEKFSSYDFLSPVMRPSSYGNFSGNGFHFNFCSIFDKRNVEVHQWGENIWLKKKQGFWTNAGIMYRPIINGLDNINSEIKFVLQFMLHAATCSTHVM